MSAVPIVNVEQGQLQGKVVTSTSGKAYYAFQGIPYAKPPLGPLRFKAPEPHEPWEGVRDAASEGNVSAQIDFFFTMSFIGDENCLFLNVYTPNLKASLPVMVWIHGGGLFCGSGNTDFYGPDYLVEKDVVVVNINYRVGALGFLCLNTPEVPGNAGLKDVVLALRWIKANVHNFGGNPDNLTVFGESAGGAIVSQLTASPLSRNLISKAIIQSGNALLDWINNKDPIAVARKLSKALGCEADNVDDILDFLSATPAKDIVEVQQSFIKGFGGEHDVFAFAVEKEFPGVEAFATEPFINLVTSGRVAPVPIIIGTTALEFGYEKTSDDLQAFIPQELNIEKDSETSFAIVEKIKRLYFKGSDEFLDYCQLLSDWLMNIAHHRYVQYLLKSTNISVYFYKFDYVGEIKVSDIFLPNVLPNKPMHGDELGYLFKNDVREWVPTAQDLKMRERMVRLWTNFAKTGNPTPEMNPYINVTWRPAAIDNEHYLHIGQELTMRSNYDKEKMDFWNGLYEKYYKTWDQPQSYTIEAPRREPIQIESRSSEITNSNETASLNDVTGVTVTLEKSSIDSSTVKLPISNGVNGDVIRANDPPEDDRPKDIGVNKYVNFYESLSDKK